MDSQVAPTNITTNYPDDYNVTPHTSSRCQCPSDAEGVKCSDRFNPEHRFMYWHYAEYHDEVGFTVTGSWCGNPKDTQVTTICFGNVKKPVCRFSLEKDYKMCFLSNDKSHRDSFHHRKQCWGCEEDQPAQMAHMDPGGCLYSSDDFY